MMVEPDVVRDTVASPADAVEVVVEAPLLVELAVELLDLGTLRALVVPVEEEVSVTELSRVHWPAEIVTATQVSRLSQDAMQSWSETARLMTLLNRFVTVCKTSPVNAVSHWISKLLL